MEDHLGAVVVDSELADHVPLPALLRSKTDVFQYRLLFLQRCGSSSADIPQPSSRLAFAVAHGWLMGVQMIVWRRFGRLSASENQQSYFSALSSVMWMYRKTAGWTRN